jgi:hypothetical protein
MRITEYRVVETSVVTDESLSHIINSETRAGWSYDGMSFVHPKSRHRRRQLSLLQVVAEKSEGARPDDAWQHPMIFVWPHF